MNGVRMPSFCLTGLSKNRRPLLVGLLGVGIAGSLAALFVLRRRANGRRRRLLEAAATPPSQPEGVAPARPVKYEYDILPRTWKARLLVLLAFVGGLCMIGGYITWDVIAFRQNCARVENPPCTGSQFASCLQEQSELALEAESFCPGTGLRVCFVPLGKVDPGIVGSLVDYYSQQYGIQTAVLYPSSVPADFVSTEREQIDGQTLTAYMGDLFPADFQDPEVVLVGLTPLDLYAWDTDWNFELGYAEWSGPGHAVVSTYRMNLGHDGLVSKSKVLERTRKMVTRYIGLTYFRMESSNDPTSPMYGHVMSVDDLDEMGEDLFASQSDSALLRTSPG